MGTRQQRGRPLRVRLSIFVLAIFVGYYVVWSVTPALHTPLMSVTNAISSVIVVGALLAVGVRWSPMTRALVGARARLRRACVRLGEHLRRLPGHPAHARHVPEEKEMSAADERNLAALLYLVAGVLFILALRGLSSPDRAGRATLFGMIGMAIAVLTTLAEHPPAEPAAWGLVSAGHRLGGSIGAVIARRVPMTSMPELVAAFHSLVGMAAVLVAAARSMRRRPSTSARMATSTASLVEMSLGVAIGAVTFTGSVIAFLKLSARMSGAPILLPGRHIINIALAALVLFFIYGFVVSREPVDFWLITASSRWLLGALIIIPIGGADMPVVISMLNSYSGWAAAGIGFTLGNSALIITGALVGSSGAILSYIMCKGMNRSFISVIPRRLRRRDAGAAGRWRAAAGEARLGRGCRLHHEERLEGHHRARLRHGGGAGTARAARDGRQAEERRRRGEIRDSPGGGPHARPHERAAGGSQRAL